MDRLIHKNKCRMSIKSILISGMMVSSFVMMSPAYAAPEGKLDLTLSTHSQNKVKKTTQ